MHAFNYMWRYTYNLRGLYETPSPNAAAFHPERVQAAEILSTVRNSGRTILTEYESKKLLEYLRHSERLPTEMAESEDEAVEAAAAIGYPVVLKLNSLHHYPQDGRRRSRAQPARCGQRAPRLRADSR